MKIAIMQPYFFPFMGYFDLIKHADAFIFLSDAQFIRRGYINKNTIQSKTNTINITIPVKKTERSASIIDVFPTDTFEKDYELIMRQCKHAYGKCPGYPILAQLLCDTLEAFKQAPQQNIGALASQSVVQSSLYLGLECEFFQSTDFPNTKQLRGKDRILDICHQFRSVDTYINRPGGQSLYDQQEFTTHGIDLKFLNDNKAQHDNSILHDIAHKTYC